MFAPIATRPRGNPTHGPTPEPIPTSGAKKGKITYVKQHRTPDITIDKLNVLVSASVIADESVFAMSETST